MDIKKHWPLIVIAVIVAALAYYFFSTKSDDDDVSGENGDESLSTNDNAKSSFLINLNADFPNGSTQVYAQGNGNSYTTIFTRPLPDGNANPNGQYTEILEVNSADEDFRFVILDYQYNSISQSGAQLSATLSDHTTYFLVFRTKNYTGKNGGFENTPPTAHNIANAIKAKSINWLTSKVNDLK